MNHFPKISLLITHYNRVKSLENLLQSISSMNCQFGDIVVSDDGSDNGVIKCVIKLQSKYHFRLIRAHQNAGLGNNINKGQDAIRTQFTLYLQEDFEPSTTFPEHLREALALMEEDSSLDLVRFYAYFPYPYLKPLNNSFSMMCIKPYGLNYNKIYCYSDHPHLRRSSFFTKFGRYQEGMKGDRTEYLMCISFIRNKGKGLFYNEYNKLFIQKNSIEEPSTMFRSSWRQKNSLLIKLVRNIYRQIKYNLDIHLRFY